jgi:hypothetical protein
MVDCSLRPLPPLKLVAHDIAEILLKVTLNTKNQIIILSNRWGRRGRVIVRFIASNAYCH